MSELSELQEQLLMRYHDGECGFFERALLRRLLARSAPAQQYLQELRFAAKQLKISENSTRALNSVDLWSRIERRIDQEKRAEIFLGRRDPKLDKFAALKALLQGRELGWGLGSLAVTAVLVLTFVVNSPVVNSSNSSATAAASAVVLAANQGASFGRPRIIEDAVPNSVEVDWMRSSGRVRMLQDPSERSAIIWVRRGDSAGGLRIRPGSRSVLARAEATRAPFGTSLPISSDVPRPMQSLASDD